MTDLKINWEEKKKSTGRNMKHKWSHEDRDDQI